MRPLTPHDSTFLRNELLAWFARNQRDLPWRRTYSPYQVWISEIMLQQTQMERGVEYFKRWIARFPDLPSLAAASEEEIHKHWEGLGYYSRARNIMKTAKLLAASGAGDLPASHELLLALPGIGPYTAGAIMSLAHNQDHPLVDANVERLFARLFDIDTPVREGATKKAIWRRAKELIPSGRARLFNQALMEFGALVCQPQAPRCPACPLASLCLARKYNTINQRPLPKPSRPTVEINMATGVLVHDKRYFIQKRPSRGVWANLWEFPGGRIEPGETPEQAVVREYLEETGFAVEPYEFIGVIRHSYMHYRVFLHCFHCRLTIGASEPALTAAQLHRWVGFDELADFGFPAGHRKLIARLAPAASR